MSRRIADIRNSVTNLAYVIGNKLGVKVVFGHQPSTDGETVYLPDLPLDLDRNVPAPYKSAEQCIRLVKREVVHEAGHVRETDFDDAEALALREEGGFPGSLLNAIEDVREERETCMDFAGAALFLGEGLEVMVDTGQIKTDFDSPGTVFVMYVLLYGAIHVNDIVPKNLPPLLDRYRMEVQKLLGEFGLARVDAWLASNLRKLASTGDAARATRDLMRLLEEIDEDDALEQQQPTSGNGSSPQGSGAGNGTQDPGQDAGGDKSDSSGQPGDGQSPMPDQPSQDTGKASGAGKGKGIGGGKKILGDKDTSQDPIDTKSAIELMASGGGVTAPYRYLPPLSEVENDAQYCIVRDGLRSDAAVLRNRIVNYFQDKQYRPRSYGETGRLVPSRVAMLKMGVREVFVRKHKKPVLDLALSLVLDASGSMDGHRGDEAEKMMILVGEATALLDVNLEILSFDSGDENVKALKRFGTPYGSSRGRIGGYRELCGGGTELGHGLMQAAYRLAERPEPRKAMFVFTDGDTCDPDLTTAAADRITREGIDLIAFGIETKSVAKYFQRYILVNSAANLASEVLRALKTHLRCAA